MRDTENPTGADEGENRRLVLIDFLRGLSIALVLCAHFGLGRHLLELMSGGNVKPTGPAWNQCVASGPYGVSIFFVLSGFLISGRLIKSGKGLNSISYKNFYIRRIARILPILALICIGGYVLQSFADPHSPWAAFCLAAPWNSPSMWASIAGFRFNAFRIAHESAVHRFGLYIGILWSLSVEEQFYFFYPILLKKIGRVSYLVVAFTAIAIAGLTWRTFVFRLEPNNYLLSLTSTFGAIDQIAVGCLLFFALRASRERGYSPRGMSLLCVILGATIIGFILVRTTLFNPADRIWTPSLLAVGVAALAWGGLQFKIPQTPVIRLLCFPGRLSYGMYLLHPAVLYMCRPWMDALGSWMAFGVYFCLTTMGGFACFYGFEKPLNGWICHRYASESP